MHGQEFEFYSSDNKELSKAFTQSLMWSMSKSDIRLALMKMGGVGERPELDKLKRRFQKWYKTELNVCVVKGEVGIERKGKGVMSW